MRLKVRLNKALVLPIAESWATTEADIKASMAFQMQCPRAILGVSRRVRVRTKEIRQKLGMTETIEDMVCAGCLP